jgi:hypothetical protein
MAGKTLSASGELSSRLVPLVIPNGSFVSIFATTSGTLILSLASLAVAQAQRSATQFAFAEKAR